MTGIAAVVLAAGSSTRFGSANKLLAERRGKPMVVNVCKRAIDAGMEPVIVVTGHQADDVAGALAELTVKLAHNVNYRSGQAGSLRRGLEAVPADCEGAMVLLGDMPDIEARTLRRLCAAFDGPASVVVPAYNGRRGNPVIWGKDHFSMLIGLKGDAGGRQLFDKLRKRICTADVDDVGVLRDYDTRESLTGAD